MASTNKSNQFSAKSILIAAGSSNSIWQIVKDLGHNIILPVPSLFTFNIKHPIINNLMGIVLPNAEVKIVDTNFNEFGPVLITHWGLSGPGVLKLSSIAARELYHQKYNFNIVVNWISENQHHVNDHLKKMKIDHANKLISNEIPYNLTKRFWKNIINILELEKRKWSETPNKKLNKIANFLCNCKLEVTGKSTFKEEFVTSGGVDLKEINFKTMESKILPNVYFAGEVLNIDALTGGFNFQAAWTTAFISAQSIASNGKNKI